MTGMDRSVRHVFKVNRYSNKYNQRTSLAASGHLLLKSFQR
jgi:hypothetical protein